MKVLKKFSFILSLDSLKGFPVGPESCILDDVGSLEMISLCVLNSNHASKRPSIKKKKKSMHT